MQRKKDTHSNLFTDRPNAVLLLWILFVICASCFRHAALSVPCSVVVTCWERADLLALLYLMFSGFCHFSIWCPRSDLVFDCIDS